MNSTGKGKFLIYGLYIGYASFLVQLLLSLLFFRERTCFSDSAFQAFFIINTKNVSIPLDRFGSALVQALPVFLVNLKTPMRIVLMAYSASFVLQNLIYYWLLHKVIRQYEVAIILALFNVFMVTGTFYLPTSEIKQGISLAILFSGIILEFPLEKFKGIRRILMFLLYTALLVTSLFLHPLMFIAVLFVVGYLRLNLKRTFSITLWCCLLVVISTLLIRYLVLPVNEYDSLMYGRMENFIALFPHYFSLASFRTFTDYCGTDGYIYTCVLAAILFFYVWNKMLFKLFWVLAFTTGYLLLVNVTHPNSEEKVYIESFYLLFGVFALYPFVMELLPRASFKYAMVALALIFPLRLQQIYGARDPFASRLSWMQRMLSHQKGKFIIADDFVSMNCLKLPWAVSFETLLFSSIASPDSARSFIILPHPKYAELDSATDCIYTPMRMIPYDELNQDYFNPEPGSYRILSKAEVLDCPSSE